MNWRRARVLAIKIAGVAIFLVLALWLAIACYIATHKKEILAEITAQINTHLYPKVSISDLRPSLLRHFPHVSIRLIDVSLRSSPGENDGIDSFFAARIDVSVNLFSLFRHQPVIRAVEIMDGQAKFSAGPDGKLHLRLFKTVQPGNPMQISTWRADNMNITYNVALRSAITTIQLQKMTVKMSFQDSAWTSKATLKLNAATVSSLTHAEHKFAVTGNVKIKFEPTTTDYILSSKSIEINNTKWSLSGNISRKNAKHSYDLHLLTPNIEWNNALSFLTAEKRERLANISLEKSFEASVNITPDSSDGRPQVSALFSTTGNILVYKGTRVNDFAFDAATNIKTNTIPNQHASPVYFYHTHGNWMGIPFQSDTITVTNNTAIMASGNLSATFPLSALNQVCGAKLSFSAGTGTANLSFCYTPGATHEEILTLNGATTISNAAFSYKTYNLKFSETQLKILFRNTDAEIAGGRFAVGESKCDFSGSFAHFTSLYFKSPEKMQSQLSVHSANINVGNFTGLLKRDKTKYNNRPRGDSIMTHLQKALEAMLDYGSFRLNLAVDTIVYHDFTASKCYAGLRFDTAGIDIDTASMMHAGGQLSFHAGIRRSSIAHVTLHARLMNENISALFRSFNNFGMRSLSFNNIAGSISATADLNTNLTTDARLAPASLTGAVQFNLDDGELIDYKPLVKIGAYLFRKRDFSDIRLEDVKGALSISNNSISIAPLLLSSNAITLTLSGIYGLPNGTDLNIDIPLRNPDRTSLSHLAQLLPPALFKNTIVHLKAQDDVNGKLKLKLDDKFLFGL